MTPFHDPDERIAMAEVCGERNQHKTAFKAEII